jgi:hypothetical protein
MSAQDRLTIVIVPLIGGDALAACLDALPLGRFECIVILLRALGSVASWTRRYPQATFMDGGNSPVPIRRQRGVEAAQGIVVAILEDTTWPDPLWCDAVCGAFADPTAAAAGGPVRISAALPSRFQALGWSEYGAFQARRFRHLAAGARNDNGPTSALRLPGNNIAFRRTVLLDLLRGRSDGVVEVAVCETLLARGLRLIYHPEMSVTYAAPDRHGAALATRLQHGRLYAAGRAAGWNRRERVAGMLRSALLPPVLFARTLSAMAGSVRPAAVPQLACWVGLMESAWALGEAAGYIFGTGKSLETWR